MGLISSVALVPYFAFEELGQALGEDQLRALLFKRAQNGKHEVGALR